jgi:hypothetical protein
MCPPTLLAELRRTDARHHAPRSAVCPGRDWRSSRAHQAKGLASRQGPWLLVPLPVQSCGKRPTSSRALRFPNPEGNAAGYASPGNRHWEVGYAIPPVTVGLLPGAPAGIAPRPVSDAPTPRRPRSPDVVGSGRLPRPPSVRRGRSIRPLWAPPNSGGSIPHFCWLGRWDCE